MWPAGTSFKAANTANVTNMSFMFSDADNFNHSLSNWVVSNCLNFTSMFLVLQFFNNGSPSDDSANPLNWTINTSSNIPMTSMFNAAIAFNQDVSSFDMTKVNNVSGMFLMP